MNNDLPIKDKECFFLTGKGIIAKTRSLILDLWQSSSYSTKIKSDLSPVTDVDFRAEELVRKMLQREYPDHGIIGEEFEHTNPNSEVQWTIDPIDGTQNLIHGIPTFGTLLGLRYRGEALLGFIDHPALDITVAGGKGLGVHRNGIAQYLPDLEENSLPHNEIVAIGTPDYFQEGGDERAFQKLAQFHHSLRIYFDCYSHSLTVCGNLAAAVEYALKVWDMTPVEALVTEAGGRFGYVVPVEKFERTTRINAAFGKKRVVKFLLELLR